MSKPFPQWLVPIGGVTSIVRITEAGGIQIGTDGPGGPLLAGTSLEACNLGLALLDATRVAGQMRSKRKRT